MCCLWYFSKSHQKVLQSIVTLDARISPTRGLTDRTVHLPRRLELNVLMGWSTGLAPAKNGFTDRALDYFGIDQHWTLHRRFSPAIGISRWTFCRFVALLVPTLLTLFRDQVFYVKFLFLNEETRLFGGGFLRSGSVSGLRNPPRVQYG